MAELKHPSSHLAKAHWYFLYHRRRRSVTKNTREIFVGQLISLSGSIVSGTLLELTKSTLGQTVGVFLLLPGVLDLGGSVAGAFGAKVNHAYSQTRQGAGRFFLKSLGYALLIVAGSSLVLGVVGAGLAKLIFGASFGLILELALLVATGAALIGLPLVGGLTVLAVRVGIDADNVIGPIETSIFDSLTVVMLFLVLRWLL